MSVKWLKRSFILGPYFTLCTDQKKFETCLKHLKIKPFDGAKNKGASTHFMVNDKNDTVAIVCLFDHSFEIEQTYALLVHEAAHIWQEYRDSVGEKTPSHEFEAYSMQHISQELFYEYRRQRKTRKGMK